MDLIVLDTNLVALTVIDSYNSLIWTDRYDSYGDFELCMAMDETILTYLKIGNYLKSRESEHVMIIESLVITSDIDDGNTLKVTGRSLESLLERRIVWGLKTVYGNLQDAFLSLLNECVISPTDANRKIPNFIFKASTHTDITSIRIETQYTGDNLYTIVQSVCEYMGVGFKIILNDKNQFEFSLYIGSDRSYDQTTLPYVIFSPKFDNILNSNYMESSVTLKNMALIGGEGEGVERRYTAIGVDGGNGINRREIFVDARDISSNTDQNTTLSESEYTALLKQRGYEALAENTYTTSFEGEADTTSMFKYGVDFFMGDVVQVANEYGHEATARVIEMVMSVDTSGTTVYPTFKMV